MNIESFELTPAPNAWPLVFRYRGPVLGNGFLALVEFHGRLLARPDGDGVWLDGVNPGALALGAASIREASLELRSTLTGVLVDFAEQAESFDWFREQVIRFFDDTDADTVGEWEACVREVQRGNIQSPALLPVCSASTPLFVEVTLKPTEAVTPKDNPEPEPMLAAVAQATPAIPSQMPGGQVALKDVWAMLDECAPGHTRHLHTHYYAIYFSDKIYPSFPKGAHGSSNPSIEKGHVRRMARFFGILECADKTLDLIQP